MTAYLIPPSPPPPPVPRAGPVIPAQAPVIPAKAGIQRARQRSAHGDEGRGVAPSFPRRPPSFQRRLESSVRDSGAHTGRRGAPAVPRRPRHSSAGPRHSSEGWNPACETAERTRGGGAPPPSPAQAPSFQRRPRHSSEGWNPACATAERTRGGGAPPPSPAQAPSFQRRLESSVRDSGAHTRRRSAPAVPRAGPVIPAKAGIQRARQRSAHGAEGRPPPSRAGRNRASGSAHQPQSTTTAHCPIAAPTPTLVACVTHTNHTAFPAQAGRSPRPLGEG